MFPVYGVRDVGSGADAQCAGDSSDTHSYEDVHTASGCSAQCDGPSESEYERADNNDRTSYTNHNKGCGQRHAKSADTRSGRQYPNRKCASANSRYAGSSAEYCAADRSGCKLRRCSVRQLKRAERNGGNKYSGSCGAEQRDSEHHIEQRESKRVGQSA